MIQDAVERYRAVYGVCRAGDWERFLSNAGLRVERDTLPTGVDAVIMGRLIVVQRGMPGDDTTRSVWHEFSHWCLHAGDVTFWLSRPQGYLTVAKFERQANEFARLFPVWEE